jgi:uncharacterized protein YjbJ (UPF0337 family)
MKSSTEGLAQGKFHEVKGKIKEEIGKLISKLKLEAKGQSEKSGGKVQQVVSKVKNILGK